MARKTTALLPFVLVVLASTGACTKKHKVQFPTPPEPTAGSRASKPPTSRGAELTAVDDQANEIELSPIYFEYDSYAIGGDYRGALEEVARWLRRSPGSQLLIEGHCDDRGTDEYNVALGERRAQAIRDYLERLGAPGSRLSIISYGEERPAVDGSGEEAWARNRRGELRQR